MLLLIGSGPMAVEYAKVLKAQNRNFTVVGRGEKSSETFTKQTSVSVITGGVNNAFTLGKFQKVSSAIVAVGVEVLYETCLALINNGVKHILLEKPGALHPEQIGVLREAALCAEAQVYIAYNRRFFSSVRRAQEIINADGGLTSFTFDFSEWGHEIQKLVKAPDVKERWLLGNSSHVIDLAFFLGGSPATMQTLRSGKLDWHSSGSSFVGSGLTEAGVPFSFHADWASPGRWGLEFGTIQNKLILRPMEQLQVMRKGSIEIVQSPVDILDAQLDASFKPGLFRQVEAFFSTEREDLCTLDQMSKNLIHFCSIAGY